MNGKQTILKLVVSSRFVETRLAEIRVRVRVSANRD